MTPSDALGLAGGLGLRVEGVGFKGSRAQGEEGF